MAGRPADVVDRLRAETRDEHHAIEQALDWQARASDVDRYRRWLERLYGFHAVWEPAWARALGDAAFFDPRRKLDLLACDLDRLGRSADDLFALARPSSPVLVSRAAALGSLYVVEGATLGGRLIAQHVRATLPFEPRYHGSYGDRTGPMWRAYQGRLRRDGAPPDTVIAAAQACFSQLRLWLTAA